jgi:hypothetical protein
MNPLDTLKKTLDERERNYDHPYENFERISKFTALLDEVPDGPTKIAMEGIMWKMARLVFAIQRRLPYDDGFLDVAGYAILAINVYKEELEREREKKEDSERKASMRGAPESPKP